MQALACDLKIWRTRRLINVHLNLIHCEVNDVLSEEVILRAFSPRRLNALLTPVTRFELMIRQNNSNSGYRCQGTMKDKL